jgi:hypothetical protein
MRHVVRAMTACCSVALLLQASLLPAQAPTGSIVAWGDSSFGQYNVPAPNTDFVAIAAGFGHSLGLKSDGTIVAWGNNESGQCDVPAPSAHFVAMAATGVLFLTGSGENWENHWTGANLGLMADGSVIGWGSESAASFTIPDPNSDFVSVAVAGTVLQEGGRAKGDEEPSGSLVFSGLGLRSDGSIATWGIGPGGPPAPNTGFVAVATGGGNRSYALDPLGNHSLGLKRDGSIVAWGDNFFGQCNVPAPNTGFVTVAAGEGFHNLGLKADGSIVAWGGANYFGECNVPEPNTGFVAVAAGRWHSLGLKADGSIVAWGRNDAGECNVPTPNEGFMAIAAGTDKSLAIRRSSLVATFLTSFAATVQGGGVTLTWQLSEAVNPLRLRLSASNDGRAWDVPITAAGTGSFTAHDASPYLSGSGSVRYVMMLRGINGTWSIIRQELVTLAGPPLMTVLSQPSPNPFNPRTVIRYSLQRAGQTTLAVYDLQGRRVRTLVAAAMPAGEQSVEWDGRDGRGVSSASGTYVVRLVTDQGMRTSKVTLAK